MFYHYFSDRTELIQWVCRRYIEETIYAEDSFCWNEALVRLMRSNQENHLPYKNILHSRYAHVLESVLYDELYVLYYCVCRYRICRTLSSELIDALKQYCIKSSKLILAWFDNEENGKSEEIVAKLLNNMPVHCRILLTEHRVSVKDIFKERELLNWAYDKI